MHATGRNIQLRLKATNQRKWRRRRREESLWLCIMVDGFLAYCSGKSDARFLLFAAARALRPVAFIKIKNKRKNSPGCDFPRFPSSVAALSIIPHSQQTLLLVKDVNLWVACSPPSAIHLPQRGAEASHLEQRFQNTALSRHVAYAEGDAIHILNASPFLQMCHA